MGVAEKEANWTCSRCEVTVRWMPEAERPRRPQGWRKHKGELYCLLCRRDLAGEAALKKAGSGNGLEQRAKLRTEAIIEFEISRAPDRPDGEIAKVVRASVPAIQRARQRLSN
jgi:hypothetical protein